MFVRRICLTLALAAALLASGCVHRIDCIAFERVHSLLLPASYDLRALYRNLGVMTTLIGYMQELGWGPYANDHEDANCQFEINWKYSDAMTTSDRCTFFKWMVRTVAEQHGMWAFRQYGAFA